MGFTIKLAFFVSVQKLGIFHGGHKGLLQKDHPVLWDAWRRGVRDRRRAIGLKPESQQVLSFFGFRLLNGHRNIRLVRKRFERCLNNGTHKSRLDRFRPGHFNRIPAPTCPVDLSGLGGETNIRSSLETLHHVDRQAENGSEQLRQSGGSVAGAEAAELDGALGGRPLLQVLYAGFLRDDAGVPFRRRRARPAEFLAIKHHALVSENMFENHRPREMTNRQSVGLSLVVYIIGGYQISRAGHVLHDGAGTFREHVFQYDARLSGCTCRTLHQERCRQ